MALNDFLQERYLAEDTFRHTLVQILQVRSKFTPDKIAYIFLNDGEDAEERITYQQLDDAAANIAFKLLAHAKPGDRALMLYPPGLEFVKALFGCFYAGIIAVPAYPPRKNRSLGRIRTLVIDSGCSVILATDDIRQTSERSFSDVTELQTLSWISTNQFNNPVSPPPSLQAPKPSDIALLQYTSGSTGQPKGVMVTHQNIMRNAEYIRQSFRLTSRSVSVTWLPSFHDMGLIDGVLVPVYAGIKGVIIPPVSFLQKPVRWLKAISKYKGTHTGGPNFAFDHCVDGISDEEKKDLDLSSLDTLYCGAEPIRKSTFDKFQNAFKDFGFKKEIFYPCYGMAETTLIISGPEQGRGPVYLGISASSLELDRIAVSEGVHDVKYLVGVGYPWIDTRVRIVNPDTRKAIGEDQVGEIWVSGSIVTAGYWEKPDITREVFSAEISGEEGSKYLRTGDLGFFHNGELYISGRLKDLIILRGRNYYPQDIEYLVEKCHPALRANASAAFSVTIDEIERLIIVAEIERTALRDLNVDEVCNAIRITIAEELELAVYSIQLLRTASILKTSSGKIQRKACRESYLNKTLDTVGESTLSDQNKEDEGGKETMADLSMIQAWLMTWIHVKLKISLDRIDFSRPIIVYGLNSMKAVQLQQDFLNKFGVNFPPYLFFEKISLKDLTERAYSLIKESE